MPVTLNASAIDPGRHSFPPQMPRRVCLASPCVPWLVIALVRFVCRPLPTSGHLERTHGRADVAPANGCLKAMEGGKMTVKQIGYCRV
jgi:hypothetical protein